MTSETPLGRFLSRRDMLRWLSASAAAGLAACGGSPSGPDGDGDGGGGGGGGTGGRRPTGPAQRVQAFELLQTQLDQLFDQLTGRAPVDELLGWLAQQDAHRTVGYSSTRDEIEQQTLIYYTGPLCPLGCGSFMNPRGLRTRFAITPDWIAKYAWSFGTHSLVLVNACVSGSSSWKQAFFDAGASVYLGWNKPVRFWAVSAHRCTGTCSTSSRASCT